MTPKNPARTSDARPQSGHAQVAYTGTVHAVGMAVIIAVSCVVLVLVALLAAHAPRSAVAVATVSIACAVGVCVLLLGRLEVGIGPEHVTFRPGWGAWQEIAWSQVATSNVERVGAAAVLGVGVPIRLREHRHIISAGSVLHLRLVSGADYWLSLPRTATPDIVASLLPTRRS